MEEPILWEKEEGGEREGGERREGKGERGKERGERREGKGREGGRGVSLGSRSPNSSLPPYTTQHKCKL